MAMLLANFPSPSGTYDVGCHDLEWDNSCSDAKSVLMRLYYPAKIKKTDTRANWIPDAAYAKGKLEIVAHPKRYSYIVALCEIAKLPAFLSNWLSGLASIKKTQFYQDPDMIDKTCPVVVFSHGLGGNRLIYSCICADLASHGFVVAAIEHREGSASLAKRDDEWIAYDNVPPEVWGFRHHQLRYRVSEIQLALDCLDHASLKGRFQHKLNMDQLIMAGHSFGGATTILMLNEPHTRFKCGLLLDPWAQPLMMMTDKHIQIKRPVIAILSEQFSFWPDNYESVQELIGHSTCANKSVCLSLNGTEHQHQSDVL
ncbi:Platelet-activating factor acetylhydrolase, partial [Rhizopus stolonifer]